MSAEKLSPRQQMIGIMYLVLLAMLAMNASKDLLDAFLKLESGIDLTANNFVENVEPVYGKIEMAAATNSTKAKETLKNAKIVKSEIQKLNALIATHKKWLIDNTGGVDENGIPLAKDNQDIGAEYLMTKGHGEDLRKKITALKTQIVALIDKKDTAIRQSLSTLLATDEYKDYEGNKTTWEAGISEHLPLAAVTANLSNIQSYLRNAESITINYLYEELGIDNYKVNKIQAATIAQSSYVLKGDQYNAQIFLAASDTTQQPIILVGDYDMDLFNKSGQLKFFSKVDTLDIKDGFGKFSSLGSSVGEHTWKGVVRIPHPNPKRKGEFLTYPFENKYLVAQPSAVVSVDKMNVMYLGPENPISISVPGIASDKIQPQIDNGTLMRTGDGKFMAKPSRLGLAKITVYAEVNGQKVNLGQMEFRVKSLPTPRAFYFDKSGKQSYTLIEFKKKIAVSKGQKIEVLYDPSFVFNLPCYVNGFEMTIIDRTGNGKGTIKCPKGEFDSKVMAALNTVGKGDKIFFEGIKAKDVAGKNIPLDEMLMIEIKN
ncbi:MAG: gliding motility protein GldM [Flavobacteriales bacterium]